MKEREEEGERKWAFGLCNGGVVEEVTRPGGLCTRLGWDYF